MLFLLLVINGAGFWLQILL